MAVTGSTWLASLEEQARQVLPAEVYRYYCQGAREGVVAAEAAQAWRRHRIVPRIFHDVRQVDLSTDVLGFGAAAPLGIAPTTLQRAADPAAEVATARAAHAAGVPLVVSSNATARFAEIAATGATWWLQAYLPQDRTRAEPLLDAALDAGASAVVLTVDTPVVGAKYDDGEIWSATPADWLRVNLGPAADAPKARDLGPRDLAWLRDRTGLPVVVKGVLGAESARTSVEAGAAGVWVSNHGGRQLDRAVSTADALVPVADAVAGAVPVFVDGGIRSGLDVLTALALGANAVFLGRLPLYALAVAGSDGVRRMLEVLMEELGESLVLSGAAVPSAARGLVAGNG